MNYLIYFSLLLTEFMVTFVILYIFVLLSMAKDMELKTRYWRHLSFRKKLDILYIPPVIYLTCAVLTAHHILSYLELI